ncbi:hypothetical protein RB653_007523 [Dictyostelium firmibasis]|uniref:Uncharacterized protein n=1 Tax=Dictyostelium firmibasis TaxID=79012 RepID=A0AAN7YUQ9_9MYCE
MKSFIISIFFVLCIIGAFASEDFYLYSVTSNPEGQYVTVVDTFGNLVLANTTLNLNDLNVVSFLSVDSVLNVITLLCEDSTNSNYLVLVDVKSGEIKKSKGIKNVAGIENNNNYVYSNVSDDIYLPIFLYSQLVILHWNFNDESDYVDQFTVHGINDIFDTTYQPKATYIPSNALYLFYKSIDINNSSKLVLLNLNNSDSGSSSSLHPALPTLEHYSFSNDFEADSVQMIYTDSDDSGSTIVYAMYGQSNDTTAACSFDLSAENSICYDTYFDVNLNPYNYNYNPYFITSDLSSIITLSSNSADVLTFGFWALNFGAESSTIIPNIWKSTNPSNVTLFKN